MNKKSQRLKIKCLDVPRYCTSEKLRDLYELQEAPALSPIFDRDGWYKVGPADWIEFEGKRFVPIGDFDDELNQRNIAEKPLRNCDYEVICKILLFREFPELSELRRQEDLRRSLRSITMETRKSLNRVRKVIRS